MGMGGEAVEASKLGTLLIMFVAVVAIALAAFLVGKGLMNTGVDNLETTAGKINDSRFSDYNNKNVRGRALKQAIDNFAHEEVAILVNNLAFNGNNAGAALIQSTAIDGIRDGGTANTNYCSIAISKDNGVTQNNCVTGYATNGESKPVSTGVRFVNYNAVLKLSDGNDNIMQDNQAALSALYRDDSTGTYIFLRDFHTSNGGDVKFYLGTTVLGKKGNNQYIADTASYQASLMKNASGEIMGIVFIQRKVS